jgi:apolipoprotein N-acyltransferase
VGKEAVVDHGYRRFAAVENVLDVGGIAGVVAIVMVLTVCALSIVKQNLVLPELWQPAILAIIGFYFGTKTSQTRSRGPQSGLKVRDDG